MRSIISTLAATLSLAALFCSQLTFAQVTASPSVINFQGRIATPSGNPVADGTYSIRFSLHDALSAGTEKWNQTLPSVSVKNGTFAVPLSDFTSTTFDGNLWLEIQIGTDAPLVPRTPLVSVPYAIKSNLALTVPDGSITNAKLAGNITADKLASGTLNSLAWLLGGNSGTNGTQFIGTTDSQPLGFRTNNVERMRFLANGNIGIGNITPTAQFQIGNGSSFDNITTLGIVQRSTDTVALSMRQPNSASRNTVMQFVTGNVGNYIEHERNTNNLLIGTNGSGSGTILTVGNGKVGIGTTTPTDNLTVAGSGTAISAVDRSVRTRLFSAFSIGNGYVGTSSNHPFIIRTNDTDRVYIWNDGTVGIGAIPYNNAQLRIAPNGLQYGLYVDGDAQANFWYLSSDARYKQNIETVPDAMSTLLALRGVTYEHDPNVPNAIAGHPGRNYGFIAQEVEKVLPTLVKSGGNGYKAVNYMGIIPVTVEAIKAQQSQISALRNENDALKAMLDNVSKRLEALEAQSEVKR